jgi:hypothetical protein
MIIYLDKNFKCHLVNDGTMTEIETDFFNNKCDAFIEGYRYVPAGETWVREDGEVFTGEMISPAVNYNELVMAQAEYEHNLLIAAQEEIKTMETEHLNELGALVEEIYQNDMEVIENV